MQEQPQSSQLTDAKSNTEATQPPLPVREIKRKGLMLILSSPSGAGKTSIARQLLDQDEEIGLSISTTTRPRRSDEVDGRDYIFVEPSEFRAMIVRNEFIEHAEVFGNFYGTPRKPVMERLEQGLDVLFDIDWQGTRTIARQYPHEVVRIFVLPPTAAALEQRLRRRAQDAEEVIQHRMAKAASEIAHFKDYDYVLVNRDLQASVEQVQAILNAERIKRSRLTGVEEFVRHLQETL